MAPLNCCLGLQSAHMAMVDALMMAYTVEMISIEKVVASVKRFSTFSASKELPYDLEDAMVFWVNKVSALGGCSSCVMPRPRPEQGPPWFICPQKCLLSSEQTGVPPKLRRRGRG